MHDRREHLAEGAMANSRSSLDSVKEMRMGESAEPRWEGWSITARLLYYGIFAIVNALWAIIGQLMQMSDDNMEKLEQIRSAVSRKGGAW